MGQNVSAPKRDEGEGEVGVTRPSRASFPASPPSDAELPYVDEQAETYLHESFTKCKVLLLERGNWRAGTCNYLEVNKRAPLTSSAMVAMHTCL